MADSTDVATLLQLLAKAQEAAAQSSAGDPANRLPRETFSRGSGFTWADCLRSVDCDEKDKEAMCVASRMATLVTQQVLTGDDECDFTLRVVNAGGQDGEPLFFGIVDDVPVGFGHLPIGHKGLASSIGVCAYASHGAIVHAGETKGDAPGINTGDTLRVRVRRGSKVSLHHESTEILSFNVTGKGKFRCAVSMSSKGQRVKIVDQHEAPDGAAALALLQLLRSGNGEQNAALAAALAGVVAHSGSHSAGDGASRLPKEKYSSAKGFTWVDTLRSVDCDHRDKVATCVQSRTATMVTAQVLSKEDACEFVLKVINAGGEDDQPMAFGIVDDVPDGFSRLPIGHSELKPSIGAFCGKAEGFIITDGKKKGTFPGVGDGDLVRIVVSKGSNVRLCKGSGEFSFKVGGNGCFRIGVSFTCKGQSAEIVEAASLGTPGEKAMKVGSEVDMPLGSDPRLSAMRTKYSAEAMGRHCGRVARVVRTAKRCIRTSLDGTEFWWDIELFPKSVRRWCYEGCPLVHCVADTGSRICDVCRARLPKGSSVLQCGQHDYDVCTYCQGLREVPPVGSKVVRGPSWKWKKQDGVPYTEGVCKTPPDKEGWVTVLWPGGASNRYRVNDFYQDVWLARGNELGGQEPVEEEEKEEGSADLGALLAELIKHAKDTSSKGKSLQSQAFSPSTGFTFVEDCVPEVVVGKSKKDARAIKDHPSHWGSIVTEQVVSASESGPFVFSIQIKALPMGPQGVFAWGLCTSQATNFQQHVPGKSEFKGSIGCLVTSGAQIVLHDDKIVGKMSEVSEGDIVGARLGSGKCEFIHQGRVVHRVGVQGNFRFVVCLGSVGQHVTIKGGPDDGSLKRDLAKVVPHVEVGRGPNDLSFDDSSRLGEGGFGVVYRGKLWGDDVVVKKMRQDAVTEELEKNFEQEVQALASLRHKNLVIFLAINGAQHLIVTEFCELGDLKHYLGQGDGVDAHPNERRKLMLDVSKGMACIAGQGMVHRDVKPENVLISQGPIAKVGDFGLVMPLARCRSEGGIAGSLLYMAPEVFLGEISERSDVYSFGLVLGFTFGMQELDVSKFTNMDVAVLVAQIKRDPGVVHQAIIQQIRNGKRPSLPESMPLQMRALVTEAWDEEPDNRPSFISLCESLTQPLMDQKSKEAETLAKAGEKGVADDAATGEAQEASVEQADVIDSKGCSVQCFLCST